MVLFIHPKNEDRLDPLAKCIDLTGGVQKYPNANRWELLIERLADMGYATPDALEMLSQSGLMEQRIALGNESYDCLARLRDHGLATEAVEKRLAELEGK